MVDPYVYRSRLFDRAEIAAAEPDIREDSVGIALSGGGTRSLVASMGQLRALRHLGVMDRVWGISAVSGGCWAAGPYVYLPRKNSDEQFLGMVVPNPRDLTWFQHNGEPLGAALNYLPPENLGSVAPHLGILPMSIEAVRLVSRGVKASESWPMMIGNLLLKPFDLYACDPEGQTERTFTWSDDSYREDVQKLNKDNVTLKRDRFRVVEHDDRPFLISTTALVPNRGEASLLPYEITPLSAGVPGLHKRMGPGERDIGGGAISPFAIGSSRAMRDQQHSASATRPNHLFSLADMIGFSSAAPAEDIQKHFPEIDAIVPESTVWPVESFEEPRNAAWPYLFADGGSLENTAVIALLRRPLRRICAFLNCETALATDPVTGQVVVDEMLPPLFGFQPHVAGKPYQRFPEDDNAPLLEDSFEVYKHSQVFSADEFLPAINGLWSAAEQGGAAMFRQDGLQVIPNTWFGVVGGQRVDILWIHNFRARAFMEQIPWQIRLGMSLPFSGMRDFPYYGTATQLRLRPREVNLLAHLAAWTVMGESEAGHPGQRNADVVAGMFKSS